MSLEEYNYEEKDREVKRLREALTRTDMELQAVLDYAKPNQTIQQMIETIRAENTHALTQEN